MCSPLASITAFPSSSVVGCMRVSSFIGLPRSNGETGGKKPTRHVSSLRTGQRPDIGVLRPAFICRAVELDPMTPTVECCLRNVTPACRAAARRRDIDLSVAPCKERCDACRAGPFVLVDGDLRTGDEFGALLDSVGGDAAAESASRDGVDAAIEAASRDDTDAAEADP